MKAVAELGLIPYTHLSIIKDPCFVQSMTDMESAAWQSFVSVTQNFFENLKPENYQELVGNMLSKLKYLGVNLFLTKVGTNKLQDACKLSY